MNTRGYLVNGYPVTNSTEGGKHELLSSVETKIDLPGHKCDNVSLRAAAETVKAPAELQAGRVLIVEGT